MGSYNCKVFYVYWSISVELKYKFEVNISNTNGIVIRFFLSATHRQTFTNNGRILYALLNEIQSL